MFIEVWKDFAIPAGNPFITPVAVYGSIRILREEPSDSKLKTHVKALWIGIVCPAIYWSLCTVYRSDYFLIMCGPFLIILDSITIVWLYKNGDKK